jgi:chemotaxis protein MotB
MLLLLPVVARKFDELALPDIQRMDREVATTLRHLVNSNPTPGGLNLKALTVLILLEGDQTGVVSVWIGGGRLGSPASPALSIIQRGKLEAMKYGLKRGVLLVPLMAPLLLAACVSQGKYDELQAQYQQVQQQNSALSSQVAAQKAQLCRLQGAIKYTVNSDLLFPSGGWQMSERGKQIIASMAAKLAPTQQNKILVSGYTDNAPIGAALQRQGITSNEILSQKRAENVMEFIVSQGGKPDLISAQGFGDTNPVAPNDTAQGRAQNRRVELSLATSSC